VALAANYVLKLANSKEFVLNSPHQEEFAQKVIEYLKLADDKSRLYEWTWIIKGFYDIFQGFCIFQINNNVIINITLIQRRTRKR
jgi:hypothetical protein